MIKKTDKLLLCALLLGILCSNPLQAYTDDDIDEFLHAGELYYKKGLLREAALEFENVLIIDKSNFQARIWLAQIYIDKKDIVNAKKLLTEASIQAPGHPRVVELQKLLGEKYDRVKPDLIDPVIAETIGGIASATKHRKYGLVIPENKVNEENLEKRLLISSDEAFNERKEILKNIEKNRLEAKARAERFKEEQSDPLTPVFETYRNQGLNKALDKYFEILLRDPTVASRDDKGLLDEGNRVYFERFSQDPDNEENRYYFGLLKYVNGLYEDSEEVLKPFREKSGKYSASLKPYFAGLDKWREQEKQLLAQSKYEEQLRLQKEAKAKTEDNDVWAKVKKKGQDSGSGKNNDLAVAEKKEAATKHTEGYNLYKKGKLNEAIAKYKEALAKDGDNPEYNYHMGLAWMDKGLAGDVQAYDNAITSYQKVINLAPESKLAKDANTMINDIKQAKRSLGER